MNQSKTMTWVGRVLSALSALAMLAAGVPKVIAGPEMIEQFTKLGGFPASTLRPIGIVEILCAVVYLIPQTSLFGAVLVAAYFGGATVTHVRMGQPFWAPMLVGICAWVGLWLRDPKLRELTPFRKI